MLEPIIKFFNAKKRKAEIKTLTDHRKDTMNRVASLNIQEKLAQRTTQELKDIALELLYLGSIKIRSIARSYSINNLSKQLIVELSDGMHNLPDLIANVDNANIKHPYHTKFNLESEIIKCISALLMVNNASPQNDFMTDDFIMKHLLNHNDIKKDV